MEPSIHDLVTGIKFCYPCIAYDEKDQGDDKIVIVTESDLSRLSQKTPYVEGMKYIGKDFWSKDTFVDEKGNYYCDLDGELYYKGKDPEGDPHWAVNNEITYVESHETENLYDEWIAEGVKFFKNKGFSSVEVSTKTDTSNPDVKAHKIISTYTLKP